MYKKSDKMSLLISKDYKMLLVMSRFGIPIGFGDNSIEKVCKDNGVDVDTFLTVIEFMLGNNNIDVDTSKNVSILAIVEYLENSHKYFLEFRLPSIRQQLYDIISKENNDLSKSIMMYFDEYVEEVSRHMHHEDKKVFPYIKNLVNNHLKDGYSINIFERNHNHIELKMTEFKNIMIKYYPSKSSNEINRVLFDIFACEEDLIHHIKIENKLLIPAIKKLEKERIKK